MGARPSWIIGGYGSGGRNELNQGSGWTGLNHHGILVAAGEGGEMNQAKAGDNCFWQLEKELHHKTSERIFKKPRRGWLGEMAM